MGVDSQRKHAGFRAKLLLVGSLVRDFQDKQVSFHPRRELINKYAVNLSILGLLPIPGTPPRLSVARGQYSFPHDPPFFSRETLGTAFPYGGCVSDVDHTLPKKLTIQKTVGTFSVCGASK